MAAREIAPEIAAYLEGYREKPSLQKTEADAHDVRMEHRVTALETRLDTILPTLATKADMGELRTEMHKGFGDMVKWIVITAFAGLAAMITIMTFVLNNAVPRPQAAAPSQQPIIIYATPAAAAPAPIQPTSK